MSFDVSVSAHCDGRGCTDKIHDGDSVYCKDCAVGSTGEGGAVVFGEWLIANEINMSPAEVAAADRFRESIESGRALAMVPRLAVAS